MLMSAAAIAPSRPFAAVPAWYAVGIFVMLFGLSFIDRLILSLLAPAINEHLQISDTQIGLLFGLGFGVVYALMGLPLAHLIDKHRRVPLMAAGVALWRSEEHTSELQSLMRISYAVFCLKKKKKKKTQKNI